MKCPACHETLFCKACSSEIVDAEVAKYTNDKKITSLEDLDNSINALNAKLEILQSQKESIDQGEEKEHGLFF